MKLIQILSILLIAITPPVILLVYDGIDLSWLTQDSAHNQSTVEDQDATYNEQLDAGLKAYKAAYDEAFAAYRRTIVKRWGEFKKAPPSVWVSYAQADNVRRSVDYATGEVQVEMLVDKGTGIDPVKGKLDQAVFRLMNTTQKQAYVSDVVAQRVEQKLSRYASMLQTGEASDERLFAMQDLVTLQMNHDGYLQVSSKTTNVAATDVRASNRKGKDIVRVSFKIPHSIHRKAARYAQAVTAAAKKEKISDELIYAIMETESSFNPMAKSHVPAYGLMQIVPHTAGKDATDYLYGKAKILAPSFLYNPENNITIGAAYLHVLHYRYMRRVKNKESRRYCAIAAYNTGASNVGRAFIERASFNKAIPHINKLSPEEVYEKLKKFLPQKETRVYIEKVSKRMEKYQ